MENNKERIEGYYWVKRFTNWEIGKFYILRYKNGPVGVWNLTNSTEMISDKYLLEINENRIPEPVPSPTIQEIKNQMRNDWTEKNPDVKGVLTVSPVPDTEVKPCNHQWQIDPFYSYEHCANCGTPRYVNTNRISESLDEQIEKDKQAIIDFNEAVKVKQTISNKEGYWKTPTGALMSQKDYVFLSTNEQNQCEFISKEIHKVVLDDKPFEKLYPTTPDVKEPEENILCAAIQYHERNNGVFAGRNHAEIIKEFHKIMNLSQYQAGKYTQGFLTTKGRFVNREDAAKIHKANGGFCNYFGGKELDSSDLEYMKAKLNS